MYSTRYFLAKLLKKARGSAVVDCTIDSTSKVEAGTTMVNSVMNRHSFCGYDCSILNCDIGSFCSIASGVSIGGVGHPLHFVSTSPVFLSHKDSVKTKFARHEYLPIVRTHIGHDVWIGERALIKPGVRIGHGAVVGMGSVVTKDVEPYSIVAGNPAHLLRMRFDKHVVEGLLSMHWWDLPDTEIQRLGPLFNDPLKLLLSNTSL